VSHRPESGSTKPSPSTPFAPNSREAEEEDKTRATLVATQAVGSHLAREKGGSKSPNRIRRGEAVVLQPFCS
jgi:hypothetical protein